MMSFLLLLSTTCLVSSNTAAPQASNFCAVIKAGSANQAVGYFSMQIYAGMASYAYNLDLTNFGIKTCDLSKGLMYHIHTSWNNATSTSAAGPALCGSSVCGPHYDPNLACGYKSSACNALALVRSQGSAYNCTPGNHNQGQYALCQVGDLSGKFGIATAGGSNGLVFSQSSFIYDYQPAYVANYLQNSSYSTMWSSIVFHCSTNARLVCAKFQLVAAGQSSPCSFPETSADILSSLTATNNYNKAVLSKAAIGLIILGVFVVVFITIGFVLLGFYCYTKGKANDEGAISEIEMK